MLTEHSGSLMSLLQKRKVLIADDEEDSRSLLNILLSQEGWEVIEASDGLETLLLIEQNSPDLLIIDNRMPNLSGIDVYKLLSQKKMNIGVILLSGNPALEELASSVGINYFLPKPFNLSHLFDLVELAYNSLF